jgi:hypothetical protein
MQLQPFNNLSGRFQANGPPPGCDCDNDRDSDCDKEERRRPRSEFYGEMVSSYLALYPDYANQVVEHALAYVKRIQPTMARKGFHP